MKGKRINFFMTALLLAAFTTASASNEAMMGSMPSPAPQQQATVRANGKVVDANGEAVIGASVVQKGNPSNGTTTDADGAFSLNVPRGSKLLVSFIGYASQEVNAGSGLSGFDRSLAAIIFSFSPVSYSFRQLYSVLSLAESRTIIPISS